MVMVEILLGILSVVILGGFVVGIIAYKPVRNKLIREKGYDADESGKLLSMFAMAAIIMGLMAGTSGDSLNAVAILLGLGIGVALQVFNIIKRSKVIGLGNALLITLLQMLSMLWIVIVWVVKMVWEMVNGMNSQTPKVNRDAERKAELMREYEAKVADIERGSDEVSDIMGDTDAAIAAARSDYEHEVTKMDHEYKG